MAEKIQYPLAFKNRALLERRFWSKVNVKSINECWPWLGSTSAKGYGRILVNGLVYKAHRLSCFFTHGLPPSEYKSFACHSCDNPPCCNPHHLSWNTKSFNSIDRDTKGRHWLMRDVTGQCGVRNPNASIGAQTVLDIKNAIGSQRSIAVRFGVSQAHVSRIKTGVRRGVC